MHTLKDISIELLQNMPTSCSAEEIMYQINLANQVLEGLQNVEDGKTLTTNEVLENLQKWKSK